MNRMNKILLGTLAIQALLVAVTWTTCQTEQVREPGTRPIFDFDKEDVIKFEVVGQPRNDGVAPDTSQLVKQDGKWVVANAGGYPADESKLEKIFDKLFALKIRSPIATQATNHNSLKVGDREYGRRVTVETKSGKKTVIIGGGSGATVHVRFADSNDVYRCSGISVWTVTAATRTYVDNKYVNIDKEKVTSVTLSNEHGKITLSKEGKDWTLDELPKGKKLDQGKVDKFVEKVSRVPLNSPIGKETKPEYGLGSLARVSITYTDDKESKTAGYQVGVKKADTDNYYYVKADDNEFVVTASKYNTKTVREDGVESLLADKE